MHFTFNPIFYYSFTCRDKFHYLCILFQNIIQYTYMTKSELAKKISNTTGVDYATSLSVVEAFMFEVKSALEKGEPVYLRGFGSFILKHRAAKTARNISKNTTVIVPEHDIPSFKPAKEFVKAISKLEEQ
nr:HU family DNA-binding protein [Phocaeicola dorei]